MGAGWDQVRSRGPQFRSESGVDRIIRYLGGGALPAVLETVAVAVHLQDGLALPEAMKHWSLTSLQTRMIKTGGRLVRHAGRLVFQLAEVLVSREMLGGILERIGRLRLAPG